MFVPICLAASCFFGAAHPVHETWNEFVPGAFFGDGRRFGAWIERFTGYGHASVVTDPALGNALELAPVAPVTPFQTHGALVTSSATVGDMDATIVVSTVRQLRAPSPNPWEAAWTIWHYTDRAHFYYFVLRANGWELGKRDPAAKGGQRFLSSGNQPHATLAQPNAVRIMQRGHRINVYVDGIPVTAYSDTSVPYELGALGLYCEDSVAHFGLIDAAAL